MFLMFDSLVYIFLIFYGIQELKRKTIVLPTILIITTGLNNQPIIVIPKKNLLVHF